MPPVRSIVAPVFAPLFVVGLAWLGAGCTATQTSASSDVGEFVVESSEPAPLPTIGLGSEIGEPVDGEQRADEIDAVVMIGDSITVASTPGLERRFAELGLDQVVIEAQTGKRMTQAISGNPSGVTVADELVATGDGDHSDELWIVALGANDVGQYAPEDLDAVVEEMLSAVPSDASLVWVDTYIDGQPEATESVNRAVARQLRRRGDLVIARWSDVAGYDGVLQGDGIHPTEEGLEVFAATVANAVSDLVDV